MKRRRFYNVIAYTIVSALLATSVLPVSVKAYDDNADGDKPEIPVIYEYSDTASEYGYLAPDFYNEDGEELEKQLVPTSNDSELIYHVLSGAPTSYKVPEMAEECENQSGTGSCWAHAALSSAQSNLIKKGYATKNDNYSETHLTWFTVCAGPSDSKDTMFGDTFGLGKGGYSLGGNIYIANNALSSGRGTVSESVMPDMSLWESPIDFMEFSSQESLRYSSDYICVNSDVLDITDVSQRDAIKQKLMNSGAMTVGYCSEDEFYKYDTDYTSYYNPLKLKGNHEVTLVGWDDGFSASKFENAPSGNGAWLCRNSWGSDFGNDGYFYISYYDASLTTAGSIECVPRETFGNKIYQYAGSSRGVIPGTDSYSICGANIFNADEDSRITDIGFDTTVAATPYEIRVYKNVESGDPVSGILACTATGTMTYAGFHTIKLPNEVSVKKGSSFSVVVIFKKARAGVNADHHAYSDNSSYIANWNLAKGTLTDWDRAYYLNGGEKSYFDINIKAYTSNNTAPIVEIGNVNFSVAGGKYESNQSVSLSCDTENVDIYYTLDGSDPVTSGIKYDKAILLEGEEDKDIQYSLKAVAKKDGEYGEVSSASYTISLPASGSGEEKIKVVSVADIELQYITTFKGTSFSKIVKELPKTVNALLSNGESKLISIKWTDEAPYIGSYDAYGESSQEFSVIGYLQFDDTLDFSNVSSFVIANVHVDMDTEHIGKVSDIIISTQKSNDGLLITLSSDTKGIDIYYTLDGSDPSVSGNGIKYGQTFLLKGKEGKVTTYTVKVVGVKDGYVPSNIVSKTFDVTTGTGFEYDVDLTINYNNGEASKHVTVKAGDKFGELLDEVSWKNHVFYGFYITESDGVTENLVTPETDIPYREKVVVNAKWSKEYYRIKFDANGGTLIGDSEITLYKGDKLDHVPEVVRPGYEFIGWSCNNQIVDKSDVLMINDDVTLIAIWGPIVLYKGQSVDLTSYVDACKAAHPGAKFRLKADKKSVVKISKKNVATSKGKGEVVVSFQVKVAKKWVSVDGIKIVSYSPSTKKVKLSAGQNIHITELFKVPLVSMRYNTVQYEIYNPARKEVLSGDNMGVIKANVKGKAVIKLKVTRGGKTKVYKKIVNVK